MRSMHVEKDGRSAPAVIAYADRENPPWSHLAPPAASVRLILDDGPHVAEVSGDGFSAYRLTRAGTEVPCDGR